MFAAGGRRPDVVRLPPARELRAAASQPFQQVDESRIAGPQIVRGAELRDDALGFVAPTCLPNRRRVAGLVRTQDEDVAIFLGQAAEGEDFLGRLVPGQHVPAAAGDIGRLGEVFDDAPDRRRARSRATKARRSALRVRARRWACSTLLRRSARASASTVVTDGLTDAALLQADVPVDADAGEFGHLLAPQARACGAAAPAGKARRIRASVSPGASAGNRRAHACGCGSAMLRSVSREGFLIPG